MPSNGEYRTALENHQNLKIATAIYQAAFAAEGSHGGSAEPSEAATLQITENRLGTP
jgi:hypothetical protein